MRIFNICLIFVLGSLSSVFADREASQIPYVTAAPGGRCFFLMKSDPNNIWNREKGTGVCYEVTLQGEFKELWRTDGWYSFKTFLTADGHYLIRLGNWPRGRKLSADHVGVGFYKDGKLLKLYSTADLIRNESAIQLSVSHYQYLDYKHEPSLEYQPEKKYPIFKLVTIDGLHYQFDVKTGQILETMPIKPEKKKEQDAIK
jgi:hypothetical protein